MELFSTIIVIIGISQGVFIGTALILDNTYATLKNKYIGATLILLSAQGILDILSFWDLDEGNLWIELLTFYQLESIVFVPYYLSFRTSLKKDFFFPKWFIFIPFLLNLIYSTLCATITIFKKKEALWGLLYLDETWIFLHYLNVAFVLFFHLYISRLIHNTPASTYKKGALSLWAVFSFLIILWIFFNTLTHWFSSNDFYLFTFSVFWGIVTLVIFWFTYTGIIKQRLVNEQKSLHLILQNRLPKNKPLIDKNKTGNHYYDQFIQLLKNQKIYRNQNLTRDEVAKKLGISSGYFSSMLSKSSDKSFNEIINEHRVQEVVKILSDGSLNHFSLVAIGLEMGFKSKSSFFSNFKKVTGSTPSEYKEKNQS